MKNDQKPPEEYVQLTKADLEALLKAKKGSEEDKFAQLVAGLTSAIEKSREPWEDPRKKENEIAMREQMREATTRQRSEQSYAQDACEHRQGGNPLSSYPGQTAAFVTHTLDTGETIGICTVCTKVISSLIPADRKWFNFKSTNSRSAAGTRNFRNPLKAQTARLGKEEQVKILESVSDGASL